VGALWSDRDIRVYTAASNPAIDCDSISYFALSVLWRAAAREWEIGRRKIRIDLGPYGDKFRDFLMQEAPFPDFAALSVLVSAERRLAEYAVNPISENENDFHSHRFTIPGITFMVMLGGRVPAEYMTSSFAPAPEHYVAIYPQAENRQMADLRRVYFNALRRA
jgi:hypothetical protein